MNRTHIRNGRLIDPGQGLDRIGDLYLADGRIVAQGTAPDGFVAEQTIDAQGLVVCPGLIDLSAHLGSLESELSAAVAGGVTAVVCPPDAQRQRDDDSDDDDEHGDQADQRVE